MQSLEDTKTTVLVIDDDQTLRRALVRTLPQKGFDVVDCENGVSGLAYLQDNDPDVLLVDLKMPDISGIDVLREAKRIRPNVECIIMTAFSRVEDAVTAVRLGAYDFLTKPFTSIDAVGLTISKAAERRRLIARARQLEAELDSKPTSAASPEIIGSSPPMRSVFRLIEGVASASSTVLVLGESGTGKELVARAIHKKSSRKDRTFVAVNCSAIPDSLIESELFGHVRGAFTHAVASRAGLFEQADNGTIFLDEVGDLSLSAQVKLMRVLQEGEIKRVGSNETRVIDVRVIAATNVDLAGKIAQGQFREDLYYRLNVIPIRIPSLRDRRDDIPLLAQHFLRKVTKQMGKEVRQFTEDALAALCNFGWPGNVRQLENAIERAVVLAGRDDITLHDLPENISGIVRPSMMPVPSNPVSTSQIKVGSIIEQLAQALASNAYPDAKKKLLREFDHAYSAVLLQRSNGNVSEAARLAGLDRSNFRRILRKYENDAADES